MSTSQHVEARQVGKDGKIKQTKKKKKKAEIYFLVTKNNHTYNM